jgi:hypothetical protein
MNERLKELELEAAYGNIDPNGPFTAEEFNQFTAKFAELIVRECLNMCADSDAALQRIKDRETSPDSEYVRYGAADYEYAAAYGKQIDHYESIADKATYAGDKIRDYFGVEE